VAQSDANRLITYMPNHQMVPINRQDAKDYPQISQISQKAEGRRQKAEGSKIGPIGLIGPIFFLPRSNHQPRAFRQNVQSQDL